MEEGEGRKINCKIGEMEGGWFVRVLNIMRLKLLNGIFFYEKIW